MRLDRPPLIRLIGPTAVGKTELSLQLADRLNGEIVSADSRLFYRGMDIGTAKPTHEERARVPHHLIDVADPDEPWSLTVFQQKAFEIIADIHDRGKLPFLVGGTGQYQRAVQEGWKPPEVKPDEQLRGVLERLQEERGIYWLHENLRRLDPQSANKIDARNVRRVIRAMEVILTTGKPFSKQRRQSDAPYTLLTIGIKRPREELYKRVDDRIEAMFKAGFLKEVQALLDKGYSPDLQTMSAIGYREANAVLDGKMSEEEAKLQMRRLTRVFVRRQANWFKDDDPSITWFLGGEERLTGRVEAHIRTWLRRQAYVQNKP